LDLFMHIISPDSLRLVVVSSSRIVAFPAQKSIATVKAIHGIRYNTLEYFGNYDKSVQSMSFMMTKTQVFLSSTLVVV